MVKRPSKRIVRGLKWVLRTATADLEAVADEKGTGHSPGSSSDEAAEALEWLRQVVSSSTNTNKESK